MNRGTNTGSLTLVQALQQAVAHHQAGRLPEAEQRYRAILQAHPNQPDANHNLGVLAVQAGRHADALIYLKAALEANPAQGQYWLSYADTLLAAGRAGEALDTLQDAVRRGLDTPAVKTLRQKLGNLLRDLGQLDGAVASYAQALEIDPDHAETHFNLGIALKRLGQLDAAAASYARAVEIKPDFAEAHNNLGNVLRDLGRLEDAAASCRRALEIRPGFAEAHCNLGSALKCLGQLDSALASYTKALEIKPDFAEAHFNLGNVLKDLGQPDGAAASYAQALEIKPDYAEAHSHLGIALHELGQIDGAVAHLRRALEIDPDYVEALSHLGTALHELGQLDGAAAGLRRALEIDPDYAEAHCNLGIALKDLGQLDEAIACFRRALKIKPDLAEAYCNLGVAMQDLGQFDGAVANYAQALEIKPDMADAYSNLLFSHNLLGDQPPAETLAEARRYGELVARQAKPYTSWRNDPDPGRTLRVGLVSGDLRNHPVGFFVESVLAALAADAAGRLEIFAYPSHFRFDAVSERIKASCHGWHPAVGLSDEALARRIRDDGIDILLDLSGHTANNRLPLFAWKPAPVQAAWLGYLGTTGVAAMDYLIADHPTLPEAEEAHFTEKIWRLPETYLCLTPPDADVEVSPLPALANGHITFGCFNNLIKINAAVVALWARVLAAVPGSRLLLKAKQFREASVRQSVQERFAACGIAAERLILEGTVPQRAEHLATFHRVDIALDPFPYPGITTSVEGLWMGVPVLTLAGERFLSRQGVGLLMNAGLPGWIANDPDDYVARAAAHAADPQRLAALRMGLRGQVLASPLFDAPRFARHFADALRGMWGQWCA